MRPGLSRGGRDGVRGQGRVAVTSSSRRREVAKDEGEEGESASPA